MLHRRILTIGLVLLVAAVGRPAATGEGVNATRVAQEHLSALFCVQRLSEFIYDAGPRGVSAVTLGDAVPQPDGSTRQTFATADGRSGTVQRFPDGRFETRIIYPNRVQETVTATPSDFFEPGSATRPPGAPQTLSVLHTLNRQDRADYTIRLNLDEDLFGIFPLATRIQGDMRLANGRRAKFAVLQDRPLVLDEFEDVLRVTLPGGERLEWRVPVGVDDLPVWSRPTTGTYTIQGKTIRFSTLGDPKPTPGTTFSTWTIQDDDGLVGSFSIQPDYSGRGQAKRNGKLLFAGYWDKRLSGTVLLANGHAATVGPSAGAQALGAIQFSRLVLRNSPVPGVR